MYPPAAQRKNDPAFIKKIIRDHPFAELISNGDTLLCSHIPILINEKSDDIVLFGHLANKNEQCQVLKDGEKVLLVFRGPHSYISSSWYQQKGKISTWDYSAVHIWATCSVQDQDELFQSLQVLYHHLEGKAGAFEDIDTAKLQSNLKHITGFHFYPERVEAITKWHQGETKENVSSVIQHLLRYNESNSAQQLAMDIAQEHNLEDRL